MILSDEHKFIYVAIPKTATSWVEGYSRRFFDPTEIYTTSGTDVRDAKAHNDP